MRWRASGAALVVLARPTNGNKGLARWSSSGTGWTDFLTEIPSNIFRFGSGCYNYICAAGLLHIMVRDISYSCGFQGQKIPIQLKVKISAVGDLLYFQLYPLSNVFLMTDHTSLQMDSWIHSGSVVCPSCSSLCTDCSLEGITSEVKSYLPMIPDVDVN